MKPKAPTIIRLLMACLFSLSFFAAIAQGTVLQKRAVRSYSPKYSDPGDNVYWVTNDTVYNCQLYTGQKIALADIDFDKKEIVKSEMLVESTKENIYLVTLTPAKGKSSYSCGCVLGQLSGKVRRSSNSVKLAEKGEAMAEFEFNILHRLDLDHKIANMPAGNNTTADTSTSTTTAYEDMIQKILDARKKDKNAVQTPTGDDPTPVSAGGGDFDSQLLALINGLKDDFQSLKGPQVPGKQEFESKVSLDGAVNTRVNVGMMGTTFMLVSFGDFKTVEEALPVYRKFSDMVDNSKKMPVSMVKQTEQVSGNNRINSWLPFGDLDPGLKGFTLVLELVQSVKFDKDYNQSDVFLVQLKIDK